VPLIRFTDGRSFDPATGEVRAGAAVTRLEPQPAALLTLLVDRAGTVVSHGEIVRHLWPTGTHVDFKAGVHYAVRQVRMAFDERAAEGRVIETLPRRGYRLHAAALATFACDPAPVVPPATTRTSARGWHRRVALALVAAVVVAAVAVIERRPNDHHDRMVALLSAVHDLVY
jgi:DNA-binding winged helix-turn-helix (wHTH) protein